MVEVEGKGGRESDNKESKEREERRVIENELVQEGKGQR